MLCFGQRCGPICLHYDGLTCRPQCWPMSRGSRHCRPAMSGRVPRPLRVPVAVSTRQTSRRSSTNLPVAGGHHRRLGDVSPARRPVAVERCRASQRHQRRLDGRRPPPHSSVTRCQRQRHDRSHTRTRQHDSTAHGTRPGSLTHRPTGCCRRSKHRNQ